MSGELAPELRVFHLGAGEAQRLCVLHRPRAGPLVGAVVHVHAFAEEMNKSRRMVALQSRQFAQAGYAVLRMDLAGCGDSAGDFGQATWADWIEDVRRAVDWVAAETGHQPWLWGHRLGSLLCMDVVAAAAMASPKLLFWQPAPVGRTLLQQFRRLHIAGAFLRSTGGAAKEGRADGSRTAAAGAGGEPEVIAGYTLHAQLASGIEAATLRAGATPTTSAWLEVTSRTPTELLPLTRRHVEEWRAAGHEVFAEAVAGPAFWQTQEIELAPALLRASVLAVQAADRAGAPA